MVAARDVAARPAARDSLSAPDLVTLAGLLLAVASARARPGRATPLLIGSAIADGLRRCRGDRDRHLVRARDHARPRV